MQTKTSVKIKFQWDQFAAKTEKKYLGGSRLNAIYRYMRKKTCTNSIIAHTIFCVAQAYNVKDRQGEVIKEL